MKRLIYAFAFAMIILLLSSLLASAGGWAVVTLDQLPQQVVAGEPLGIGFIVRQHGRTPLSGLTPKITATRADTNESFTATAKSEGAVGHYVATLTFPSAGTWAWTIDAFGIVQPMPTLRVLASVSPETAPTSREPATAALSLPLAAEIIGLIGIVAAGYLWVRTRRRLALALLIIASSIGATGFLLAANRPVPPAQAAAPNVLGTQSNSRVGEALFVAKGCIICHRQSAVNSLRGKFEAFSVGPDLSHWAADPGYLRRWLKDPSAIKPGTEMPTLGLSEEEIEALVAFLRASPTR